MDLVECLNIIKNNYKIVPNILESIVLFVTKEELESGIYDQFVQNFIKSTKAENINIYFLKKIHFKLIIDKNINYIDSSFFNNYCKSVEVIKSKNLDINFIFFESFKYLVQYNTTLFLSCRYFTQNDWIEKIYNFTRFSGGFWISADFSKSLRDAALLATGNYLFLFFIKLCYELFIIKKFNHIDLVDKIKNEEFFELIKNQFLQNNIFFNFKNTDINKLVVCKDFDYIFYYKKYPEVVYYYINNNIPDDVRAYHHYLCFGKEMGFVKNENEISEKKIIEKIWTDISQIGVEITS